MNKDDRILITGSSGFLGRHVVTKLTENGYRNIITFSSKNYDLTKETDVGILFREKGPFEIVIHLAAVTGGIGFNKRNPAVTYFKNLMMNTLAQEFSLRNKVRKFVGIGSVCEYPKFTKAPFVEDDLWGGYPEESNAPYGLAKKMMLVQSQAYRQEYGFNGIHLLLANMYGPHDNFDLETSHAIPALIRRCFSAIEKNEKEIICWGDGTPTREFLYVEDAAEGIMLAAENYDKPDPVNIGTGNEISIKELVNLITRLTGFNGEVIWDTARPNGQARRCLSFSRAKREFGFTAKIALEEGLKRTIAWYKNRDIASQR